MCNIIVINKGEKEIGTPRQFQEHFGFAADKDWLYDEVNLDSCLCQCNVEKTFADNNIEYKMDLGDYYVGMLDSVIGDNDSPTSAG